MGGYWEESAETGTACVEPGCWKFYRRMVILQSSRGHCQYGARTAGSIRVISIGFRPTALKTWWLRTVQDVELVRTTISTN